MKIQHSVAELPSDHFRVSRNFPRISQNFAKHKIKIWAKISQFRETLNQNVGNILAILQERDNIYYKKCQKFVIFGTQCKSSELM